MLTTQMQDQKLLDAVRVYGTNWSTIASFHTPQRTTLALKNQYWKLRQRSQNASKRPSTKNSSPATSLTAAASTAAMTKTAETNDPICSSSDDAESDEEGDRNEESESEEPNVNLTPDHADQYYQVEPMVWIGDDWTGKTELEQRPVSPKLSLWTGYHPKCSSPGKESLGDTWMEGLVNPVISGDNSAMALYSQDGLPGAVAHDGGKQGANLPPERQGQVPQPSPDDDAINLFFADLDDISQQNSASIGSNWAGSAPPATTAGSPTVADMLDRVNRSDSGGGDHTHLMANAGLETLAGDKSSQCKAAESLSHSVSIKFSCTTGQLSDVMSLLANTGLPINIKIDTV